MQSEEEDGGAGMVHRDAVREYLLDVFPMEKRAGTHCLIRKGAVTMFRVLLVLLLLLMGSCSSFAGPSARADAAAAKPPVLVQVSDKTFPDFYEDILLHNRAKNINLHLEKVNEEPVEGEAYDIYLVAAKRPDFPDKKSALIQIFTNKAGYVSKIAIMVMMNNQEGIRAACLSEYVLLGALGIPDHTDKMFMKYVLSHRIPFTTAIWDEWGNRNLVVYHGPSPVSDAAFYIRITAYDKRFPNSR